MNILTKRKRKRINATYHECILCKGLHPITRRNHGYLLDRLNYARTAEYAMKSSEWRKKSPTVFEGAAWQRDYEILVDFERKMKSYSDSRYERDQRRREGKWW